MPTPMLSVSPSVDRNPEPGGTSATNTDSPIASVRPQDLDLVGATLLGLFANTKEFRCPGIEPFEHSYIPPLAERFTFARSFCNVIVQSERFLEPELSRDTTLLLTVIATCLITDPHGQARGITYQDIGAMLVSATRARPCVHLTAQQANSLTRFLIDLTHSSAARLIPDVSVAIGKLTTMESRRLASTAEIAIRAVAAVVGSERLAATKLENAESDSGAACYAPSHI